MKKGFLQLSLLFSLVFSLCLPASASVFSDVADQAWYSKYIQRAFEQDLVSGKPDGTFDPDGQLTFQEFAVMVTNAYYGSPLNDQKYIYDYGAMSGGWGEPYTLTLKNTYSTNGNYAAILQSLGNESKLDRYHTSYIIGMLLTTELERIPSESGYVSVPTGKFQDLDSLNSTSMGLLGVTLDQNIMFGDSETTFAGKDTLTRAEACVILCALMDLSDLSFDQYTADPYVFLSFRYDSYLSEHFDKHQDEFSYHDQDRYLLGANIVVNSAYTLSTSQEDGDTCYYIEETNEFVVVSGDGYLRTYFKPDDGIDYFLRQ